MTRVVSSAADCPLCIAGTPGRHPDKGGTHPLITRAIAGDAPDVWSDDLPPGGYVCGTCGQPTESEPCQEHQVALSEALRAALSGESGEPKP